MKCPKCGHITQVTHLTTSGENEEYRRRRCRWCGRVFFTIEFDIEENEQLRNEWPEMFKKKGVKNA